MQHLVSTACLVMSFVATAETIHVSPADPRGYVAIEAARPGDEVILAPGRYSYLVSLTTPASAASPIRIRAADPANPPVFDLAGAPASSFPGSATGADRGQGVFRIAGPGYIFEGLVLRNCSDPAECAGFRLLGADEVVIRGCTVEDTDVGLEGEGDRLLVVHTRISRARTFGVHLRGGTATLRYDLINDSGQLNVLSGAWNLVVEASWIARAGGHSFQVYQCSRRCGGRGADPVRATIQFTGNLFLFGAQANPSKLITLLGGPASVDQTGHVRSFDSRLSYNTFVGAPGLSDSLIQVVNPTLDTALVTLENNAVVGFAALTRIDRPSTPNVSVTGGINWLTTGTVATPLTGSAFGASPAFLDAGALDFRPSVASPLTGLAVAAGLGAPPSEYANDETECCRYRRRLTALDIGAFEHDTTGPAQGPFPSETLDGGSESPAALRWLAVGCTCAGAPPLDVILGALWVFALRRR